MASETDGTRAVALHRRAMQDADAADTARRAGEFAEWTTSLRAALENERSAAQISSEEPSRSVLLRSAATLALELAEFREAERLVAMALAADPPAEIADELRDVLEQVYFTRHLDLRGMTLERDEFQMSIAGDAVGYGLARSERFLKRAEDMQRLLYRTAERQARQPFRDQAAPRKTVRDGLEIYVSVPRAASLAVSFRLARPRNQEQMFPESKPQAVVSEILTCMTLLNEGRDAEVKPRFSDDAYYLDFIGLAKQIAPDGQAIKLVGLTAVLEGREVRVPFQRKSRSIAPHREALPVEAPVEIRGRLLFADARRVRSGQIQIVAKNRDAHAVLVPAGMMNDIVRPLLEMEVIASCNRETREGRTRLTLVDVRPASEE